MKKLPLIFLTLIVLMVTVGFAMPVFAGTRPNYVYDNANLLTAEEETVIHDLCYQHDLNSTNEVVVYTMEDLDKYGGDMDLAREKIFNDVSLDGVTGIGKSGKDNGILLVVARVDSRWGIEVGYGLEGDMTDGEAARIGRALKPELQAGNYTAIITAVEKIIAELSGESTSEGEVDTFTVIVIVVVIIVIAIIILAVAISNDSYGGGYGGSGGSGSSGGGWGGGFGGGGSGGGGASGLTKTTKRIPVPPSIPPKPKIKYKVCPTCKTKRRCELVSEYESEKLIGVWWWALLLTTVTCGKCSETFSTTKMLHRKETISERKARKAKEARERRKREARRRREEEDRQRRARQRRSSYSSSRSSFGGGGFGGGGFGGGGSGGGGASG